jgi:hypothetical protein
MEAFNKMTLVTASLAIFLIVVLTLAQQSPKTGKAEDAFRGREKAMRELAGDNKNIVDSLKTLTAKQKNAVVALMALTRAAATYESRFMKKDDASLRALYGPLSQLSPAYRAPGKFQSLLAGCFNVTASCLKAQKQCHDDGKKEDECDRDPKVLEPCANEAICVTNEFLKLHKEIPRILEGRDPWPPQPFPY